MILKAKHMIFRMKQMKQYSGQSYLQTSQTSLKKKILLWRIVSTTDSMESFIMCIIKTTEYLSCLQLGNSSQDLCQAWGKNLQSTKLIYIQISPRKKLFFSHFAAVHPLREIIFFAEKNKNDLFRRGFFSRNFAEKLRDISRRHSATFHGETPRNFTMGR